MGYQILNDKIVLNKNKNIGKVLYIVEGETREINILAKIFMNILNYDEVIRLNRKGRRKYRKFSKKDNRNSQIVIINSKTSNINSISNKEFVESQLNLLKEYGLDYEYRNSAIYYIFDADRKEDNKNILELIEKYNNSRESNQENNFDAIAGMLLLSYPSVESFIISNFEKDMYKFNERFDFSTQKLKEYINKKKYSDSKLSEKTIEKSFLEMVKSLKKIDINKVNLDNVTEFSKRIFDFEKLNKNQYMLSLILISFIDLGIIEILE